VKFGKAFGLLAKMDPADPIAKTLNDKVIETLYDTNPHPIASLVGPDYQFRKADGSNNNVELPNVGRAGMPYARSVQGRNGLPRTSLPDSGLVFDALLKRDGVCFLVAILISQSILISFGMLIATKTWWRNVQLDLRICCDRHSFVVPHESRQGQDSLEHDQLLP